MKIEYQKFIDAIKEISKEINENQDWLSELDQSVGDGDHGVNMSRGFNEVAKLDHTNLSLSNYISLIGRTLMSKVYGASYPLYGMCFMNTANNIKESQSFTLKELKILVQNFVNTLTMLGKVKENEKTMFDVWKPLNDYLVNINEINLDIKNNLINFIFDCAQKTKDMIATKGRASYLKERSTGTIDPGSYSSYIILKNIINNL
ncbi:dihydroxyacetone kinase subunit DhaL [Mycoplasmopsis felis]|uniref:dihydroxyacetone kinase subunit DhaL n=1 Tax=Mycoplasmopsis felis TaxID=33923 RepID=UPI0021E09ADE|nr:dihydroxyacetone kinase subunit DhaL [Mycoplasmopsis felis]MCU9938579.1 dihydroxyacetone kinase subunit DhaL [Mycoplasmopsis felis]